MQTTLTKPTRPTYGNANQLSVNRRVSLNSHTHPIVLEALSYDSDFLIKQNVARNPNTPKHILERLANDNDHLVREGVARNPNTPKHILERLATDHFFSIRSYAKKALSRD